MTFIYTPQQNLKSTKFKIGLIQTFLNKILDSQEVSQKILDNSFAPSFKTCRFQNFWFKNFKNVKVSNVSNF